MATLNQVIKAFKTLEIAPTVDQKKIRKAALELLKKNHPDKNVGDETSATEKTQHINNARDLLTELDRDELEEHVRAAPESQEVRPIQAFDNGAASKRKILFPIAIGITKNSIRPRSFIETISLNVKKPKSFYESIFGQKVNEKQEPTKDKSICIKVMLSGDGNSRNQFYFQLNKSYETPSNVDFITASIEQVKHQIWNLAGQEKFRAVHNNHLKTANVILYFGDSITEQFQENQAVVPHGSISNDVARQFQNNQDFVHQDLYSLAYNNNNFELTNRSFPLSHNEANHFQQLQFDEDRFMPMITQLFHEVDKILEPLSTPASDLGMIKK